jgi:transcriptional regulator with XRE-family HTH domain
MKMTKPLLGNTCRAAREAKGVKLTWVAKQMGISGTYLSDLEHNRRDWSAKLLAGFNQAVGTNIQPPEMETTTA